MYCILNILFSKQSLEFKCTISPYRPNWISDDKMWTYFQVIVKDIRWKIIFAALGLQLCLRNVLSCEFCEIFKNNLLFYRTFPVAASYWYDAAKSISCFIWIKRTKSVHWKSMKFDQWNVHWKTKEILMGTIFRRTHEKQSYFLKLWKALQSFTILDVNLSQCPTKLAVGKQKQIFESKFYMVKHLNCLFGIINLKFIHTCGNKHNQLRKTFYYIRWPQVMQHTVNR